MQICVLDEPSNFLDREALGGLAVAIRDWAGAVVSSCRGTGRRTFDVFTGDHIAQQRICDGALYAIFILYTSVILSDPIPLLSKVLRYGILRRVV